MAARPSSTNRKAASPSNFVSAVWSGGIGLTGWWRLIEPLIATEVRAGEAAELRRLKERLELVSASASASTGGPATS